MEQEKPDQLSDVGLQMDSEVRKSFAVSAKWTKFISVTIFIFCVLLVLFGIAGSGMIARLLERFDGGQYSDLLRNSAGLIIIIFVVVAIFAGGIYYFLFNYSRKIQSALRTESSEEMAAGLNSLKVFFIICTILTGLSLLFSLKTIF